MIKRIFTGFLVLSIAALVLSACSNGSSEGKADKKDKKEDLVATVNGEGISKKEYKEQLDAAKSAYEQQGMPAEKMDAKMKKEMKKSVLDQMINSELLLQTAKDKNVKVDQKEIDAELKNIKSGFKSEKQYQDALKKEKLTEEELKKQMKQQLVVTKYIESKIGEVKASDEEIQALYDQYKQQMESQKQKVEPLEKMKPQLEQQVVAQKKDEKASKIIEEIRKANKENIEVLL